MPNLITTYRKRCAMTIESDGTVWWNLDAPDEQPIWCLDTDGTRSVRCVAYLAPRALRWWFLAEHPQDDVLQALWDAVEWVTQD